MLKGANRTGIVKRNEITCVREAPKFTHRFIMLFLSFITPRPNVTQKRPICAFGEGFGDEPRGT